MASRSFVCSRKYDGLAPRGALCRHWSRHRQAATECRIDGEVRQSRKTSNWVFEPEQIVPWLTYMDTPCLRDVITCGSSPGMIRVRGSDICEVDIEGIGILRNHAQTRSGFGQEIEITLSGTDIPANQH